MSWLKDRHKIGTYCFAILSVIAFCVLIWALVNVPSKNENNHYSALSHQQNADAQLVPPDCIGPEGKTSCKYSEREIEKYRAERSALAAQWKSADLAHIATFTGLLGISLLFWTLYETFAAGKALAEQNAIALNASKAEFQPYLSFSDKIAMTADKATLEGITTRALVKKEGNRINPKGFIQITNEGKTPVLDGLFSCIGCMRDDEGTIPIELRGQLSYLGSGKHTKARILEYVRLNRDVEGDKFDISKMWFRVEVRVSFRDPFSEYKRRVFRAIYDGGYINDGPQMGFFGMPKRKSFAEVEPRETDDPKNWEV